MVADGQVAGSDPGIGQCEARRWKLVFLGLTVVVTGASLPALGGEWVYDDRLMIGHPMLDGLEDVGPAFHRSSDDYQSRDQEGPTIAGGTTYRPFAMISLMVVNGVVGTKAFPHHVVSLLLHLLVVGLFSRLARASWAALLVVCSFALHPAMGEAFLWINGRADVLAGAALAAMLVILDLPPGRRRDVLLLAVVAIGSLTKETFVVAAGFVLITPLGVRSWRLVARDLVLCAIVEVGVFLLRGSAGGTAAATLPPISWGGLAARAPHVLALAVETLVVPLPRTMRFLAWEVAQPLGARTILLALVPFLVILWAIIRRNTRVVVLVLGAVFSLLPTALVGDAFWLGFDRYLYLPAILCTAAALPWLSQRRWPALVLAPTLILAALTFVVAGHYRSHAVFAYSMLADRPDDPAGYLLVALDAAGRGDRREGGAILRRLPQPTGMPVVAHNVARAYLALGDRQAAAAIVEQAVSQHPGSANLKFDLFVLRSSQGRWDEALKLAEELATDPSRRRAMAESLAAWVAAGAVPDAARARFEDVLRGR